MCTSCYSDKNAILSNQAGRVLTLPGIKVYPHHVLLRTCRIWVSYLKRILYEAESAGCLLDFIQSDDDALDISTFRKQLVDLFNSDKNKKTKVRIVWLLESKGTSGTFNKNHRPWEDGKTSKKKKKKNIIRIIWSPKRWKWSYLLLGGVEGEIANIQSVALLQQLLLFITVSLKTHNTM